MPESSTLNLLVAGGPVLWLTIGLGAFAFLVFLERLSYLHRGQIRAQQFLAGIRTALGRGRLVEALTVCEEAPGPVAAVVKAALLRHGAGEAEIRRAIEEAALIEIPALERRLGSLAAVAQVAPILGLLGTVLGAMGVFIAFHASGNFATAAELADGTWKALLNTAAGLAVGIAAHLGHHFLSGRVRALVQDMEWAAHQTLQMLLQPPPPPSA